MKNSNIILKKIYKNLCRENKLNFIIISFQLCGISCFAQESPYYQLPQNRKHNYELLTMPHLNTFTITYFLAASVGIKKSYFTEYLTSPTPVESNSEMEGFWDITIGQNRNDNWIFELGIAKYNSNLNTNFTALGRSLFPFRNEMKQYYLPFRLKKKIITLDKVSRSAFLNLGIGVSYLFKNQKKTAEKDRILFNQRPIPEPRDYTTLDFEMNSSNNPLAFEFITEIRGKVSERLEITAFGKAFFRPDRYLSNQFTFNYVDQTSVTFGIYEKPLSILFGIQALLNSPKYYGYKSRVD